MKYAFCQRMTTKADSSGNSRVIWIAYNRDGHWIAAFQQHHGNRPKELENSATLIGFVITVADYRETIAAAKHQGIYHV